MKKSLLLCLFALLVLAGQAQAYSLSLNTGSNIAVGDTARVDVNLALSQGEELFGYNFALSFDPSIFSFDQLSPPPGLLKNYLTGFTPPGLADRGLLTFDGALLEFPPASTNLTIASLFFTGLATGTSPLAITGSVLDLNGLDEIPLSADGSITVNGPSVVPEPATLLLLGSGLAGLCFRNRNRRSAA